MNGFTNAHVEYAVAMGLVPERAVETVRRDPDVLRFWVDTWLRALEDRTWFEGWVQPKFQANDFERPPRDDPGAKTEIVPRLWVGAERAARALRNAEGWRLICVRETDCEASDNVAHVPLLRRGTDLADTPALEEIAAAIDVELSSSEEVEVLVHCWRGIERSPLAVAWWLCTRQQMSLDAAYGLVRERRPQVDDCRDWLSDRARNALKAGQAEPEAKEFDPQQPA